MVRLSYILSRMDITKSPIEMRTTDRKTGETEDNFGSVHGFVFTFFSIALMSVYVALKLKTIFNM